jgi:oxamate amidohydrolase
MRAGVAVAAPHHLAVDAAQRVVGDGGNAIDAAVAAAAALTVVYPHQCSLGGDLFALVRQPDGAIVCVNASGRYGTASVELPLDESSGRHHMPVTGPLSVSVPGCVSGWERLVSLGGSKPAAELLAPAIALAEGGFDVSPGLAAANTYVAREGVDDPGLRHLVLGADGAPRKAGERLVQAELASTLRALARDGMQSFYRGATGEELAMAFVSLGIPISRDDLSRHEPLCVPTLVTRTPLGAVHTAPPNSQGYLLLSFLDARAELEARGHNLDARAQVALFTVLSMRRAAELADPDHLASTLESLTGKQRAKLDVDVVHQMTATEPHAGAEVFPPTESRSHRLAGDTVAVTVVAGDGTAVSLIQSLFHGFGSLLRDPQTGIVFHNRAASFSAQPASPNALAPGKRPAHTLMPVLVEQHDGGITALGAMGGRAQPQIHAQLIQRVEDGLSPADAVAAPRFIVEAMEEGSTSPYVMAEQHLDHSVLEGLQRSSYEVQVIPAGTDEVGHAMICRRSASGRLESGADPRSDGAAEIC